MAVKQVQISIFHHLDATHTCEIIRISLHIKHPDEYTHWCWLPFIEGQHGIHQSEPREVKNSKNQISYPSSLALVVV